MKILHLRASNFYGGPERQLHLHAKRAFSTDCNVTVASFRENGERAEFLGPIAADGISTHCFEVQSAYDPRCVGMLRGYLSRHAFDLLCTHEYRSSALGWLAVHGTSTKWIAFSRGFTTENLKVRAFQWLERLVIRRADHIVAVSRSQKQKVERLWIPAARIAVIPNAIDPELMEQADQLDLRARFGFSPDDFVCVTGGRFSPEKGQIYLAEAAVDAIREEPRVRMVLFGDGPNRSMILRRIEQLGLKDRVYCPGFEENMPGCIRAADLLINPSLSEGLPNVILEAMAIGTPVLATAVGGVPEIIADGASGRLVVPGDARALADRVVDAVRNPEQSRQMALRAAEYVREELGFERQFERMREVYGKVVSSSD